MPERRPRRIKQRAEASPPAEAGGTDTRPESATAATARPRGRPAAKVRKLATMPDVDGHAGEDAPKSKQIGRATRRRGKLHQMLDMPLDIIMEICANLQLRDILYLSRLSKTFYAFFTRRGARFMWKSAARNVPGLPPCPADLNEISYAQLLFDAFCHNCNGKNCYFVYWGCRVRLCKKCLEYQRMIQWKYTWPSEYKEDIVARELMSDHASELKVLLPMLLKPDGDKNFAPVYYTPQIGALIQAWKALPQDNLDAEREAFLAERVRSTAAIRKTIRALEKWYQDTRTKRDKELSRIHLERRSAIMEHLKEDGWQPELDYLKTSWGHMVGFLRHPGVRKAQALSPRIWASIKSSVVQYMEEVRKYRLHEIDMKELGARLVALGEAIQEVVSEMGERYTTSFECEVRIPELFDLVDIKNGFDIKHSRPVVRHLVRDYLRKRDQKALQDLADALRREHDLDESVDPFSLAVGSYFRCVHCDFVFKCQEAIHHVCQYCTDYPRIKPDWMSDDYFNSILNCLPYGYLGEGRQLMWSVDNFKHAFSQVVPVIEACGFDVKTATVEDLDADKDLRLICLNHKTSADVPIMTWRTAAFSQTSCCQGPDRNLPVPQYKRATEEQLFAAHEPEALAEAKHKDGYYEYFCAYCAELPLPHIRDALRHTRTVHDIQHPSKEEDWVLIRTDETIPVLVYLATD